jgi:hypothetical protein
MPISLDIPEEFEGGCLRAIRWPLRGHLGLCYQHDHIAVYYMGPSSIGVWQEGLDLLDSVPALCVACRNCHCGWLEPADWYPDGFDRDD